MTSTPRAAGEPPEASTPTDGGSLLVGFDGSPDAAHAITVAAHLMPARHARVAHIWTSLDAGSALYRRLAHRALTREHLERLARREAAAAADGVVTTGVALAAAAGWTAEPLVRGEHTDEGVDLAALAEELRPRAVVVGSRGLGGVRGLLGSVSEVVVHRSPVPVLVVPPLLAEERAATTSGPAVVAHDGTAAAAHAHAVAADLLAPRVLVSVHVEGPMSDSGREPAADPDAETAGDAVPADAHRLTADGFGPAAVADALAREAAARRAGVIVVGSRQRSLFREVVLGSHARAVLHHGHRPVLIVPPVPDH